MTRTEYTLFLAEKLREYLDSSDKKSIRGTARKCLIPHQTLGKIAQGEKKELSGNTALKLGDFLLSPEESWEKFKEVYPDAASRIPKNIQGRRDLGNVDSYDFDRYSTWICDKAQMTNGVGLEQITRRFGRDAIKSLKKLVDEEILTERSGRYFYDQNVYVNNLNVILKKIESDAKNFDLDRVGPNGGLFRTSSGQIPRTKLKEFDKLTQSIYKQVNDFFNENIDTNERDCIHISINSLFNITRESEL